MPNFLGSSTVFSKEYARPIAAGQLPSATAGQINDGSEKLKQLHQQVLPFILRRVKDQVLRELPPKQVTVVRAPLSSLQKQIYADFCQAEEARTSLNALEESIKNEKISADHSLGSNVLKTLLFLRLLCTHPALVLTGGSSVDSAEWWSLSASGKMLALIQSTCVRRFVVFHFRIIEKHTQNISSFCLPAYFQYSRKLEYTKITF